MHRFSMGQIYLEVGTTFVPESPDPIITLYIRVNPGMVCCQNGSYTPSRALAQDFQYF